MNIVQQQNLTGVGSGRGGNGGQRDLYNFGGGSQVQTYHSAVYNPLTLNNTLINNSNTNTLVSGLFPNQNSGGNNQNLPSKADFNALKEIGELFVKLNQHLTGYTNLTEEEIVFYLQELKRLAKENEHLRLNI